MDSDPHGYRRLYRSLRFLAGELRAIDRPDLAALVDRASEFSSGSPSEFVGESREAIKAIGDALDRSNPPAAALTRVLASEL